MDDQNRGNKKREKEVHGDREKAKKKMKSKDDTEMLKRKRERKERKEKRKRDKDKRKKKLEKVQKTKSEKVPSVSLGATTESPARSRLSGGEEHQKHTIYPMDVTRNKRKPNEDNNPLFANEKNRKREPSPELARISALKQGPPKTSKCDCKVTWFRDKCPHSSRPPVESLKNPCSSSRSNPPHLERADIPPTNYRKPTTPPSLEREDISKFRAALRMYCDEKMPPKEVDLGPPVLEPLDPVAYYYDSDGNKVWLCPTCGGQDDGSPMIGCDGCDAWYHWVCVGMQTAPEENEDWYCRHCVAKRRERMRMKQKLQKKKPSP